MKTNAEAKEKASVPEGSERDISSLFDYGIDLKTKTLYLGDDGEADGHEGGLTARVAGKVIKGLHILDNLALPGPLTILLNLEGGDEVQGLAIYDAIKSCKNSTVIKVYGQCMSMGAWILQAGNLRLLAPNSSLMIHAGVWGMGLDHPEIIKTMFKHYEKSEILVENLLLKRIRQKHPDFTLEKLRELLLFETYLSPPESIDLGLADEIILERSPVP